MKKKTKKKSKTSGKVLKCEVCNVKIDFCFHECNKGIQEYYGCKKCDDWCTRCNPNWDKVEE